MISERGTLINPMARHLDAVAGPIRITHAEGVYLYDDAGRSWIDCETGSGLFSLGHRDAFAHVGLMGSLENLDIGNHHLISSDRADLASTVELSFGEISDAERAFDDPSYEGNRELILDGDSPERFVFNVSAAECIDSAVKLARGATGKSTIICAENAYHGCTGYALAASASVLSENLPVQTPGFVRISYGSIDAVRDALAKYDNVAAVMLEPFALEAGCVVPPWTYLRDVRELCWKHRVLLILDESVTGLGRTGYAYQWSAKSAYPDILIAGRALCAGIYPLYATCHTRKLDRFYLQNPFVHISTFGGGEVGCGVAWSAVHALTRVELLDSVRALGQEFRNSIENVRASCESLILEARGAGLLNAVRFRDERVASSIQNALFQRGVFCRKAMLAPECLLFIPPLTIAEKEHRAVIDAFCDAISETAGSVA